MPIMSSLGGGSVKALHGLKVVSDQTGSATGGNMATETINSEQYLSLIHISEPTRPY